MNGLSLNHSLVSFLFLQSYKQSKICICHPSKHLPCAISDIWLRVISESVFGQTAHLGSDLKPSSIFPIVTIISFTGATTIVILTPNYFLSLGQEFPILTIMENKQSPSSKLP